MKTYLREKKLKVDCPYCGRKAKLVSGTEVHSHRPDLKGREFWVCWACDAKVGCHPDGTPFGRLANKELRGARKAAHQAFDPLWQQGHMTRKDAYMWLALKLKQPVRAVHIGGADLATCRAICELCRKEAPR